MSKRRSVVANAMGLQVLGPGALRSLASQRRVITARQSGAVCLKKNKALVLLDLEHLGALFASASEEEHGGRRYR